MRCIVCGKLKTSEGTCTNVLCESVIRVADYYEDYGSNVGDSEVAVEKDNITPKTMFLYELYDELKFKHFALLEKGNEETQFRVIAGRRIPIVCNRCKVELDSNSVVEVLIPKSTYSLMARGSKNGEVNKHTLFTIDFKNIGTGLHHHLYILKDRTNLSRQELSLCYPKDITDFTYLENICKDDIKEYLSNLVSIKDLQYVAFNLCENEGDIAMLTYMLTEQMKFFSMFVKLISGKPEELVRRYTNRSNLSAAVIAVKAYLSNNVKRYECKKVCSMILEYIGNCVTVSNYIVCDSAFNFFLNDIEDWFEKNITDVNMDKLIMHDLKLSKQNESKNYNFTSNTASSSKTICPKCGGRLTSDSICINIDCDYDSLRG